MPDLYNGGWWIIGERNNQNCKDTEDILVSFQQDYKITNKESMSDDDFQFLKGNSDELPIIYLNGVYFGGIRELKDYVNNNFYIGSEYSYFNTYLNP